MTAWLRAVLTWVISKRVRVNAHRARIAAKYISGQGIEIGALDRVLPLPAGATATYLDRLWVPSLRLAYPELAGQNLAPVSLVDNAEELKRVPQESQDFLIANNVLGYCEDVIGTLFNWFRVLQTNGVLFLTVPEKSQTADRHRPPLAVEHLIRDHQQGGEQFRTQHYQEYVRYVQGIDNTSEVTEQIRHLGNIGYSIPYHVWTRQEFLDLIVYLRTKLGFDIELVVSGEFENIAVLRKKAWPVGQGFPRAA
jgi:hypothetical protein